MRAKNTFPRPLSALRRRVRIALATVALAVALPVGWAGWLQASGNFHTVVAGEVYRSAQPTPAELRTG